MKAHTEHQTLLSSHYGSVLCLRFRLVRVGAGTWSFLKAAAATSIRRHENSRFLVIGRSLCFCSLTHSGLKTNLIKKLAG